MAVNQAIRTAVAEEISLCGVVQLPPLCRLREFVGDDANYRVVAVAAHDLVTKLGFNIYASDGCIGQLINGKFKHVADTYNVGYKQLDVGHGYAPIMRPDMPSAKTRLQKYVRSKGDFISGLSIGANDVLVDLTIDGNLYNPQNEDKFAAGDAFKADYLLTGRFDSHGCYTVEDLSRFAAFAVYVGPRFLCPVGKLNDKKKQVASLKALFETYDCTITPTNIADWWGVYLVGTKRGKSSKCPNYKDIVMRFVTLNILKAKAVVHGFTEYVVDTYSNHHSQCSFLGKFPVSLKALRSVDGKQIGSDAAYKDYLHTMENKNDRTSNLVRDTDVDNYFRSDINYDNVDSGIKEQAALFALFDEIGGSN